MAQRFSLRTDWDIAESTFAAAIRKARERGRTLLDLTVSNPTLCGFDYSPNLLQPLTHLDALAYDPDPRGLHSARQAIAAYYASHHAQADPDQILLTTSTSEAYSFLFRLLANPGDAVLVGQPGYPLFDFLATLDDVVLTPYPLFYDFGWWIDFAELEQRITPRTRALVLVHPNNPTGHATTVQERRQLERLCVQYDLALIVDEVFLDYGLECTVETFAAGPHPCLTFIVSGLSKIAALPQMKLGWLAAFGPDSPRQEALSRLEIIADTFLSMNAPIQLAAPTWLENREAIQTQIAARVRENLKVLGSCGELRALPVEAGWCAVLRLPQSLGSDRLAEQLAEEANVVTHPGSFYGMPESNRIVVSLLGRTELFASGARNLNQWCESKKLTHEHHGSGESSGR